MYRLPPPPSAHDAPPLRVGAPLDPLRLALTVWRWRWVFVAAGVVGTTVGLLAAKYYVTAQYTSKAVVERDAGDGASPMELARDLATVAESVKIDTSLETVRTRLGLDVSLERLARRIEVQVTPGASVFTLSAEGPSPGAAQSLARATLDVALARRVEVEQAAALARRQSTVASLAEARAQLSKARQAYDAFRVKYGISDVATERRASLTEIAALRAEQLKARAEAAAERARAKVLERVARTLPKEVVVSEAEVRPDLRKLLELEAEHAAAKASLTAKHPRTQALAAEVEAIRRRVADPRNTARGERTFSRNPQLELLRQGISGATAQGEAARKRHASIAAEAAQMENRVARLTEVEGRANELLGALLVADAYVAKLAGLAQSAEEAVRRPAARLRVLSAPTLPQVGRSAKRYWVAVLVPLSAVLLTLLLCLLRAVWGLRVRSPAELAYWGRAPVITATDWPRSAAALDELALELEAPLCDARGKTLLVPAGPAEAELATELAERLVRARYLPRRRPAALLLQPALDAHVIPLLGPAPAPDDAPPERRSKDGTSTANPCVSLTRVLQGYIGADASCDEDEVTQVGPPPSMEAPQGAGVQSIEDSARLAVPVRLAAQLADRVLVVFSSGAHSYLETAQIQASLGYPDNVGFVLVNTEPAAKLLPGRQGDVPRFWAGSGQVRTAA